MGGKAIGFELGKFVFRFLSCKLSYDFEQVAAPQFSLSIKIKLADSVSC